MTSKARKKEVFQALECLGPKVTLVARVKSGRNWKRFNAAYDDKGHILPNVVIKHGQQVEFSVCRYELRYTEDGIDHRPPVGDDAVVAEEQRTIVARQLAVKRAKDEVTSETPRLKDTANAEATSPLTAQPCNPSLTIDLKAKRVTQAEALAEFVQDRELQEKLEMAKESARAWKEFVNASGIGFLDEVNRKSLLLFHKEMRERGLSPRTAFNQHRNVQSILKLAGLDPEELNLPPAPKFELKLPTVYTSGQLQRLFAAADEYEHLAFNILLKLGLRSQELSYAEFSDINFESGTFRVQGKPKYDFKVKDHEQREIPIPDCLLESLRIWKERHAGQSLILATVDGNPDLNLCARVKALATRAGLNCGACATCKKIAELQSRGAKNRELHNRGCMDFNLHKFRRTYITGLLRSRIDIRTVSDYAGHADIKTTMRYLRPISAKQCRSMINQIDWQEGLNLGL